MVTPELHSRVSAPSLDLGQTRVNTWKAINLTSAVSCFDFVYSSCRKLVISDIFLVSMFSSLVFFASAFGVDDNLLFTLYDLPEL